MADDWGGVKVSAHVGVRGGLIPFRRNLSKEDIIHLQLLCKVVTMSTLRRFSFFRFKELPRVFETIDSNCYPGGVGPRCYLHRA